MLTRDFQPAILTEDGDLVFLGPNLQYFSTSQSLTIKWILENRAGEPGHRRRATCSSPTTRTSARRTSRTPCVAAPVFVGDELFCWVANMMHLTDVGGSVHGQLLRRRRRTSSTSPPAFPPFKLVETRPRARTDVEQLFLRQTRVPADVQMDLRAAIAANNVAAAQDQRTRRALRRRRGQGA